METSTTIDISKDVSKIIQDNLIDIIIKVSTLCLTTRILN